MRKSLSSDNSMPVEDSLKLSAGREVFHCKLSNVRQPWKQTAEDKAELFVQTYLILRFDLFRCSLEDFLEDRFEMFHDKRRETCDGN